MINKFSQPSQNIKHDKNRQHILIQKYHISHDKSYILIISFNYFSSQKIRISTTICNKVHALSKNVWGKSPYLSHFLL